MIDLTTLTMHPIPPDISFLMQKNATLEQSNQLLHGALVAVCLVGAAALIIAIYQQLKIQQHEKQQSSTR